MARIIAWGGTQGCGQSCPSGHGSQHTSPSRAMPAWRRRFGVVGLRRPLLGRISFTRLRQMERSALARHRQAVVSVGFRQIAWWV